MDLTPLQWPAASAFEAIVELEETNSTHWLKTSPCAKAGADKIENPTTQNITLIPVPFLSIVSHGIF
jgi:hypothetical protein